MLRSIFVYFFVFIYNKGDVTVLGGFIFIYYLFILVFKKNIQLLHTSLESFLSNLFIIEIPGKSLEIFFRKKFFILVLSK